MFLNIDGYTATNFSYLKGEESEINIPLQN